MCSQKLIALTARRRSISCVAWLLVFLATTVNGEGAGQGMNQPDATATSAGVEKVVGETGRKPFLKLKDPVRAGRKDVQQLYEQSGQTSAIAYLLFAAAIPFSELTGSSNALLLYLTPTVLRIYASKPSRCSSELAALLYDLSLDMYGTKKLQDCHYDLYVALGSVFSWVRDNIPLTLEEVPNQPLAAALWPDLDRTSPPELIDAVAAALTLTDSQLSGTASRVTGSCGMAPEYFAGLVPDIVTALKLLHADLPMLQTVMKLLEDHWKPQDASHRRALLSQGQALISDLSSHLDDDDYDEDAKLVPDSAEDACTTDCGDSDSSDGTDVVDSARTEELAVLAASASIVNGDRADDGEHADDLFSGEASGWARRRSALTLPPNLSYIFPPSTFLLEGPGAMPRLYLPLVFHIMLYQEGTGVGPEKYDQARSFAERLVRVTNYMAAPTRIQFFIKEVRNDAGTYPYLLLSNRTTWLQTPLQNCSGSNCFNNRQFMNKNVQDFPRSINIFVSSDSTAGVPLGYAYVPGSDVYPDNGHVFMTWDSLSTDGANSLKSYDDGPNTLLHELFHHLGLQHPFDYSTNANRECVDGDYVIDTPASLKPISSSGFFATAQAYCMELFWGQYGGDWQAAYERWSVSLGIPDTDMNAWADSCPALAGYDELGNYMTYNTPVCFSALGHFTEGQAQRAHLVTSELNPILYSWGQYYARVNQSPPPLVSPPPEFVNNTCRSTARLACPCKSSWERSGVSYSFCDRLGTTNALSCEVADPSTCGDCPQGVSSQCILACAGTPRICKRPPAPGSKMPPPPPPRPPPSFPWPPPPPPRFVPPECMRSRSGCECRSTWSFNGGYWGYCASPDNDTNGLWCQISPSCSSFNNTSPYQYCLSNLTNSYCGGQVFFTTSRVPPMPPSLPPDTRPRPPPSPPSTAATVQGRFILNGDCSMVSVNATELRTSLITTLAQIFQVPQSYISITLACGSIVVDYVVSFPAGTTTAQVTNVYTTANTLNTALGSNLQQWGAVTQSSAASVSVLQPSICSGSSASAFFCASSSPPPSSPRKSFPTTWIIVGSVAGVGILLIILLTVGLVVYLRNKQQRVAPEGPTPTRSSAVAQDSRPPPPTIAWTTTRTPPTLAPQYPQPYGVQQPYQSPQYLQPQYPQPPYQQPGNAQRPY